MIADLGWSDGVCYPPGVARLSRAEFGNAVLVHADALYRLALRLTRQDDEAEDLVQDTYARALGASDQFEAGTNVRAWVFRILRNAHIDARRRTKASPVTESLEDDPRGRDEEPIRGDIEAALSSLSVDARTVVLLDLEGFTEAELATVLDCPVGTVKSRLARARAALRERLRDYAR
jgi:RNA polymerase sigma-70 factor, ECF subfamily